MRVRRGFVSNSSSCSFTVIDAREYSAPVFPACYGGSIVQVPHHTGGVCEFGSHGDTLYDFGSKLNWALLQAISVDILKMQVGNNPPPNEFLCDHPYWKDFPFRDFDSLVLKVRAAVLEQCSVRLDIFFQNETDEADWRMFWFNKPLDPSKPFFLHEDRLVEASIDHGSLWRSNPELLHIFETRESLRDFLFGRFSRIEIKRD